MKFYNYINDCGECVIIIGFDNLNNEYEFVLNVFEVVFEYECEVMKCIYNLFDIVWDECEYVIIIFLKWFVDE